ncbi:hypothetical protein SAMN05660772_00603 [Pasteurella testudinis DSM 23072]|uniref:DUF4810 domain-containing protein n=1 Tax=Pasteurella testudinis DSM 23072 TaxID=1122938 RepID=A0A1W1UQX7_9PAST|nr:DUF4810 domain-containing protein [Pasteurella testudinis]SMB83497.1 hypothetical protein SAMN05660772_00603 [Pasteurella testudinis DSM 23072]SUB51071.1 Uncharacterised protein [Pasteurella testudinis]
MMKNVLKPAVKAGVCCCALFLAGCAANTDLYAWKGNSYAQSLYDYMNSGSDETEQIATLDSILAEANQKGKKVPPGLYAQLGLLHSKQGDWSKSQEYFNLEKQAFPESAQYIHFLQNQKRGGK